jgi:L-fucose mutarotase
MLKGISPVVSPELLYTLHVMGHGDEIVLADAHFPAESLTENIIRADGVKIQELLGGIMMDAVEGDSLDLSVEEAYLIPIKQFAPDAPPITRLERFAFYERAKQAFAILMTGELAKYGNIILKKGVTPA